MCFVQESLPERKQKFSDFVILEQNRVYNVIVAAELDLALTKSILKSQ